MKVFKESHSSWFGASAVLNSKTDIKAEIWFERYCVMFYIGSIKERSEWPFLAFDRSSDKGVKIQTYYKNFWGPSIYKRRLWRALKEK
jgi:hypothetical protein